MLKAICKAFLLLLGFVPQLSYGQPSLSEVRPKSAVTATLQLFDTYPVVGVGEAHSLKELGDFYIDLVSQPDFAEDVGNVVFEFGNAFFQPVVDRYLAGEDVPHIEVKKAWTTTIAAGGPHEVSIMYGQFYETVRAVNRTLPNNRKIKVWLGDPPANPEDPPAYSDERFPDRDAFFANIVLQKILAKDDKALLIIGAGHFMSGDGTATTDELEDRQPYAYNVKAFVEGYYPGKLAIIQIHWGLPRPLCNRRLETRLESGRIPSLTSLRNTGLTNFLNSSECNADNIWGDLTRAWGDAYLYLGKSDELTLSPLPGEPETPYLKTLLNDAPELEETNE